MSQDLTPAADALAAQQQAETYAVLLAALAAQKAVEGHGGHGCGCQGHAPAPAPQKGSVARPLAIAAGAAVCGCVLTGLFLAVALTAMALGVSSLVVLFLIRELRKGAK